MIFEINHLRVSFGETTVLHDVNLSFEEGEICGLIGPNGAGKSTTIAAAVGLLHRDNGLVRVLGKDPQIEPEVIRSRLGVFPEQNGFYEWMTAPAYLQFFAALCNVNPSDRDIRSLLARVGLHLSPGQCIGTFSRGMRQRLGLARALIARPTLLVLDEPTNGLDPRGRRDIHDILIDLSANHGVGILLCTHLLDDIERLCKRVGVIVDGRTVAEGSIDDLIGSHGGGKRFQIRLGGEVSEAQVPATMRIVGRGADWCTIDLSPKTDPQTAWRELLLLGWPMTEVRREGNGLEKLYLDLTEGGTG